MKFGRIFSHLSFSRAQMRRLFPASSLRQIEMAVAEAERKHAGQIRFAVETGLSLPELLAGRSARDRALEVFSKLRIWDTEHNNGVLIYLLLADRRVEIVADRGVHAKLGQGIWDAVCREMETAFRQGQFEAGVLTGIHQVGAHLALHYPPNGNKANELPDQPVLL